MTRLFNLNYSFLFLSFLFLLSCQDDGEKKEIARLVTEWQGKEIIFPEGIVFMRYLTDTIDFQIPETDYKVLVYVDSFGCISCKLQLDQWKSFIEEADSLTRGNIPFLFFFHHDDYKKIGSLLKRDQFDLPVCIDLDDQLNKLNEFPSDMTFQTFLLDKENRVVIIGNPVHNLAVRDLYLKQLTNKEHVSGTMLRTAAEVECPEIDMGFFPVTEKKKALFTIKNTGNDPLVILGTTTTCGCATTGFDKQPANPGGTLQVEVEMAPKESGFFSEVITVKCNTDEFIKLTIKGQAQ
ncbi:DUF1573 domain-containing protein [Parabacteroides sp. OttesenSCG-928-G07]|nr:DUF1573 domain-containing protein [Parabacteroides sp. OttesenSCG-928-G07]